MTTTPAPNAAIRSQFASDHDMQEIIALFVEEMPARLDELLTSWQRSDVPNLVRMAHQLKGAGGGYGFPAVSAASGALEQTLRAIDRDRTGTAALDGILGQFRALIDVCRRLTV